MTLNCHCNYQHKVSKECASDPRSRFWLPCRCNLVQINLSNHSVSKDEGCPTTSYSVCIIYVPKIAVVDTTESFNFILRKPAMCLVSPALNLPRGSEHLWWLKFLCPRARCNIQDRENLPHVFEMWKIYALSVWKDKKGQSIRKVRQNDFVSFAYLQGNDLKMMPWMQVEQQSG